jgi:hypothetical protein
MEHDVGVRVDELYRGDPDGFTAARNELVAALKAEGRDGDASEVRSLRKPTVAAWAVNRLVGEAAGEIDALLKAGERLRAAQRGVMSGTSADAFREAAALRRSLVNRLVERAAAILDAAGRRSSGAIDDIRTTLEASSVSEEAAALVREARLAQPLMPPTGFDQTPPALTLVKPRATAKRTGEDAAPEALPGGSADDRSRTRPEQEERRRVAQLTRRSTAAERGLDRARAHEQTVRGRVERAERALSDARGSLRAAEAERRGAAVEAKRAHQAADAARRRHDTH